LEDQLIAESKKQIQKAAQLVESKEREVRVIKESNDRTKVMSELLAPLNEEKATLMKSLLESVQTPKLKNTFDKYLPAVLNNGEVKKPVVKQALTESAIKEVTGDKSAKVQAEDVEQRDNVIDIKRLAGL